MPMNLLKAAALSMICLTAAYAEKAKDRGEETPAGAAARHPRPAGKGSAAAKPKGSQTAASGEQTASTAGDPIPGTPPQPQSGGCQFRGDIACAQCLHFWSYQGDDRNNHMCKDKSRANGTRGWDCFNFAEDTSHGYRCIAYCPTGTDTCENNCNQKNSDGSPNHKHPLRQTRNIHTGRVLGPPGFAPVPHQGKEQRNSCVW